MKTQKIMIITAIVLISIGLLAIVYLALDHIGTFDFLNSPEKTQEEHIRQHDPIEYTYDDEDRIVREVYYEDNVYQGSTDYYYDDKTTHKMVYDKDDNLIENVKTKYNSVNQLISEVVYENTKLISEKEIVYYEDMMTKKKETVINYTDKGEEAVKTFYNEKGEATSVITYLNDEVVSEEKLEAESPEVENEA